MKESEEWELESECASGSAAMCQLCFDQMSWRNFELRTNSIRFKDWWREQLIFFLGKNIMRKPALTFP